MCLIKKARRSELENGVNFTGDAGLCRAYVAGMKLIDKHPGDAPGERFVRFGIFWAVIAAAMIAVFFVNLWIKMVFYW